MPRTTPCHFNFLSFLELLLRLLSGFVLLLLLDALCVEPEKMYAFCRRKLSMSRLVAGLGRLRLVIVWTSFDPDLRWPFRCFYPLHEQVLCSAGAHSMLRHSFKYELAVCPSTPNCFSATNLTEPQLYQVHSNLLKMYLDYQASTTSHL